MQDPIAHPTPPKRLISVLLGISALLLVLMVVFSSHIAGRINGAIDRGQALANEHSKILLYDEILTMSASMAAATGNLIWIERYNQHAPLLLASIAEALALSTTGELEIAVHATDTANNQLVEMEHKSFDFVRAGDYEAARALLNSPAYLELKQTYASGMETVAAKLKAEIGQTERFVERSSWLVVVVSVVELTALVAIWVIIWRIFASWRQNQVQLLNDARQARQQAEEAGNRIKAVVETAIDAIIIIDRYGTIESVNPATEQMFGYPAARLLHKNISMLMPQPFSEAHDSFLRRYHQTGETQLIGSGRELKAKRADGHTFPIELSVSRLNLQSGLRFSGVIRDISERKLAEKRLEKANSELRLMSLVAQNTDNAVIVTDTEGLITWVNNGFTALSGYTLEETLGQKLGALLQGPDTDPAVVARINQQLSQHQRVNEEILNYHKSGTPYWLHIEISPVHDEQGELLQFVALERDITQRKEAEHLLIQAREDAEEATREHKRARSFLSTLMDALPVALFYKDAQGRYLGCNKLFEHTMGVTEEQIRAKTVMELWPGDLAEAYHHKDLALMRHPEPQTYEHQVEAAAGNRLDVLYHKQVFYDEKGMVAGIIGAFVDISELKHTERLLAHSKKEAEDANRAKSTFLATMSHEIRTPLNGVVGTMDMLERTSLLPNQLDLVHTAKDSAHLLRRVIDDVLDFSKIEAGRLELESTPLSLEALLETVSDNLRYLAEQHNVELLIFCAPDSPLVVGDSVRLKQIIFNLAGNAIKFSTELPERSGRVKVSVHLRSTPGQQAAVTITVDDNGIGMSEDIRQNLFQSFMQGENNTTRRFGGTGLGLVITQRLVEMMAGQIEVQSEPGRGSTFSVFLPLPLAQQEANISPPSLEGVKVLLLDGQDDATPILKCYLEYAGAVVIILAPNALLQACGEYSSEVNDALVIIDNYGDKAITTKLREQLRKEGDQARLTLVITEHGPPRHMHADPCDTLTLNLNAMHRSTLVDTVAAAIGRKPREPLYDIKAGDQLTGPLGSDEARAAGRMILLVDDNEINRKVIGQQLGILGCGVEYAENGQQALEKWGASSYNLLLTDCHMPQMDGYELARCIRKAEGTRVFEDEPHRFPIIAITADALKGTATKCYQAGMDGYLTKPLQLDELGDILDKYLCGPADELPPPNNRGIPAQSSSVTEVSLGTKEDKTPEDVDSTAVDLDSLAEIIGTREPQVLAELYQDFLDSNGTTARAIEAAASASDFSELGVLAHKMKSAARTLGANQLADSCFALELACKEQDVTRIAQEMRSFPDHYHKVEVWVSRYTQMHG